MFLLDRLELVKFAAMIVDVLVSGWSSKTKFYCERFFLQFTESVREMWAKR